MPVFGLNQGAMPILGYNYGARNKDRLMKTYKEAFKVALIVMAAGTVLFQAIPAQLLLIFDASEEMLRIGVPALRLISLCFIPAAFGIITGTLFPGNRSRSLKPVCFGDKTTCGNSAAGVYTDKDWRSDAFLAGVSSGRNIRTHIQRYHTQVVI